MQVPTLSDEESAALLSQLAALVVLLWPVVPANEGASTTEVPIIAAILPVVAAWIAVEVHRIVITAPAALRKRMLTAFALQAAPRRACRV